MQRVIKFRFWDIRNQRYIPIHELEDDRLLTFDLFSDNFIVPEQFTGCYDRNNNEIYEGDILKLYLGQKVLVKFIDGCFNYFLNEKSYKPLDKTENMNLSVLGSSYQNSDLLN